MISKTVMIMESRKKVLVFGDSLARGVVWDESRGRYVISPCAAVRRIAERTGYEIVNRARMGMTAEGGLACMQADLARGVTADVAVIEFGGNDSDFDWRAISEDPRPIHQPKTRIETYESNLRCMISMAKEHKMSAVLCSLPPILSENYFDFFSQSGLNTDNILCWLGDKNKIYRYHELYSLVLLRLAKEYGCRLLDLRSAFLEKWDPKPYFCRDGIHPNDRGQTLIADTVLSQIASTLV